MLKKFIKCLLCSLLVVSSMIFVSSKRFASEVSKADNSSIFSIIEVNFLEFIIMTSAYLLLSFLSELS